GMSLPVVFHQLLFDLYSRDVYMPLSLFTSPNLEVINSEAATLTMRRLNAAPSQKEPRILDPEVFERTYGSELLLDRGQWIEPSRNLVSFIEEASGDDRPAQSARWNAHYGFF
ncbi:hypothetical protein DFH09DRAFT_822145, partial [Mycena vulgaris]